MQPWGKSQVHKLLNSAAEKREKNGAVGGSCIAKTEMLPSPKYEMPKVHVYKCYKKIGK